MKKYNKKNILREDVIAMHEKYGLSPLEASVFLRRGITSGSEILYYLENDLRFMHEPFLFKNMEDAVDRITGALEEKEKVLIFGDKDVDGITSTAILYSCLKSAGMDVQWRLPLGEDAYGLSENAINDFAKEYGSLIITVDCGISNNKEIEYANSLGIDVIVTDHHNPPENLPNTSIIIDPKIQDSGYPFKDISGAAVAFKLVSALRFSKTDFYAQDICLLNAQQNEDGTIELSCIKTRNLVKKQIFSQTFSNFPTSVYNTNLPNFLKNQQIFVWNKGLVKENLKKLFGTNVDFQMFDIQKEIEKIIPQVKGKSLKEIKHFSKIAKYSSNPTTEVEGFFNIFVTWVHKKEEELFPNHLKNSLQDLQLVGIAALADIMPMKDENRIFVKTCLSQINKKNTRQGIAELIARMDLTGKNVTSTDLSWKLIPSLNASGRMGQSNLSLELLINEQASERNKLAQHITELNEQRKQFVIDAELYTTEQAKESLKRFNEKLCIIIDEKINRGITGILAAKIMQKYDVPTIAITFSEDKTIAIGSMRSCRGLVATTFLDSFGNFFINHGGHDCAAGFSFNAKNIETFIKKAEELSKNIKLEQENDFIEIDAELPVEHITPALLELVSKFEPFGEENPELIFMSKKLKIQDAIIVGKSERQHLKITFDCGKYKFPAMFWGEAERLNKDFSKGDSISVLYNINKNSFNGAITPQMILIDAERN